MLAFSVPHVVTKSNLEHAAQHELHITEHALHHAEDELHHVSGRAHIMARRVFGFGKPSTSHDRDERIMSTAHMPFGSRLIRFVDETRPPLPK